MSTSDARDQLPAALGTAVLARLYVALGDHAPALDQLDSLLAHPYFISPAWLGVDPSWAPLKGNPRFERLIAQPATGEQPTP